MSWNVELPDSLYFEDYNEDLQEIINEVTACPLVAIDTETTGLDRMKDVVLFWSMTWGPEDNMR